MSGEHYHQQTHTLSLVMESVTRVQIRDKAFSVSLRVTALGKVMNRRTCFLLANIGLHPLLLFIVGTNNSTVQNELVENYSFIIPPDAGHHLLCEMLTFGDRFWKLAFAKLLHMHIRTSGKNSLFIACYYPSEETQKFFVNINSSLRLCHTFAALKDFSF